MSFICSVPIRRTANLIRGSCLPIDNLAADDDRRLSGLYDNHVCLLLVKFRLAAAGLAACFQEQVISPVSYRLARESVFHGLMQFFFVRAKLLPGPVLVAGGNCRKRQKRGNKH